MASPLSRLPLLGEAPPAPKRAGLALAAKGFRPFFLLAGVSAALLLPLWLLCLWGRFDPGAYLGPLDWHAHEMVSGYAVAVLAGFLLTAVGNWTQRETVVGPGLLALAVLWVAGRLAVLGVVPLPPAVRAAVDLAFLPCLIVVLARPLWAARNRRNVVMLVVLAALWVSNLAVHLDALGLGLAGWRRRGSLVGVDVLVTVLVVMAARVFPMFTRNGAGVDAVRNHPRHDQLATASVVAAGLVHTARPGSALAGILAALAAVAVLVQHGHWGPRHTLRIPLLWVLHLGYLWIPVGLGLRALATVSSVPASASTHALTAGALGTITLGMMARVSLGHTGRPLEAPRAATAAFVLVSLAALLRVGAGLVGGDHYRAGLAAAGVAWSVAFALFVAAYAGVLTAPRVDGKAG
jgi:uncharacterized protein involved in response to NO